MRTIPSRLALIVVLAMAVPALVMHGQQNPEAMPQAGLVRLLDEDRVAFGVTVDARADPVALSANDDIDFVFFDMEHGPYDVSALRTWMQWLLNPAAIAATGDAMAGKAVIVRIPATGRELDQNIWMVKQVLDVGAHGIIFPTVETPEQALMAIRAMRYPQRLGAPDPEPAGLRGTNPRLAARYWGLSVPDYIERADVWRLDPPNGNLLPWILIESPLGVATARNRVLAALRWVPVEGVRPYAAGRGGGSEPQVGANLLRRVPFAPLPSAHLEPRVLREAGCRQAHRLRHVTRSVLLRHPRVGVAEDVLDQPRVVGDTAPRRNVRLRLDLGTDDSNLANSRKAFELESVRYGGRTLRFSPTRWRSATRMRRGCGCRPTPRMRWCC